MSISKPTAEEMQEWNKRLAEEGLSERRAESHRVVYGGDDSTRLAEITWRKAKLWIKRKRKAHKTVVCVCTICATTFNARAGAKTCSGKCRFQLHWRSNRYSKRTGVRGAANV